MMGLQRRLFDYTASRPCRLIHGGTDEPYLERYFLSHNPRTGVTRYLHRFVSDFGAERVHDHPWDRAWALCLAGGYQEQRVSHLCCFDGWQSIDRQIRAGRINRLRGRDFHRIVSVRPETWTLFCHGPYTKGWGFLSATVDPGTGRREVTYRQPFEPTNGDPWWLEAPLGADAGRELFIDPVH